MARGRDHSLSRGELLAAERGRLHRDAPRRVALVYPSPYRTAMSSLGYQSLYRQLNQRGDLVCDRVVLPDDVPTARAAGAQPTSLERDLPLSQYPLLAFSVAYELELGGVIDCLELAGIPVLARDRGPRDPVVIAGGPLTFSNPAPMAPYFDAIVVGEGEELLEELVDLTWDAGLDGQRLAERAADIPHVYVGAAHGESVPSVAQVDDDNLPARSQIITPHTELASMYLTEAVRGCSRGCTYCVMRRSTNGGMRVVAPELILDAIPEHARRVGLVGAGVTDHPRVWDIVRGVVESGREVGISSLRADRLDDELVGLLAAGGYRTLTIAADGASERMRRVIERSTQEKHLLRSAELAKKHGLHTVKIYMMVGHPDETDDDIDELIRFTAELRRAHPRIAYGIAPFVAKRHTPLDGSPFAGISLVEKRLQRLRKGLKGSATVRPTSARWAWVEYMLSQGTSAAGLAVYHAHKAGGRFADYKRAFQEHGCEPTGPVARVPSSNELISMHRLRRSKGLKPLSGRRGEVERTVSTPTP